MPHEHGYRSAQEEWQDFLRGTHPLLQKGSPLRFVPSRPRCKLCKAPFGAPGRFVLRRYGYTPWSKNPNLCSRCFVNLNGQAALCPPAEEDGDVRGAEVEASMLFADVRGSSKLARQIPTMEFSRLMNRFYRLSREVLIGHDAVIEKFVGDQIVGLFVPFLAGDDHARKAMDAARELFRATGHEDAEGPWVPLGAGVHTGSAFVGMVGEHESSEFTALGDPVNIAAHLASQAGVGEILLTEAVRENAGLPADGLERRHVSLKGHPFDALVLSTLRVGTTTG
jgi:adenylate cyclase